MLVYQFQGKSALWGGGAGTVRGARGKLTGQGPVFHLACLVLLIRACLASRFVPYVPMPPGAQTAQGSQPFHLDLNSGLRTPLFISLFFFC